MLRLEILLQAVDRLTAPIRAVQAGLARTVLVANRLNNATGAGALAMSLAAVGRNAAQAAGQVAALGGRVAALAGAGTAAAGFAFNRALVRPAADMQNSMVVLSNMMGEAGARSALSWMEDFARTAPFQLGEVQAAFIQLRNLGLDPTRGSLRAVGDAAAGMNTSYADAVGAFSAAMRGEMDPIERFGVFGRMEGQFRVLNWRDRNNREQGAVVRANDREGMAAALQRAMNDKFEGMMEARSATWDGMLSNMSDAWTRFATRIMQSGPFQWMNDRLKGLLEQIDRLEQDGTLQRWAEGAGAAILRVFTAVERFFTAGEGQERSPFMQGLADLSAAMERVGNFIKPVTDRFGSWETALGAIGLVLAGPLIGAVASLGGAITILGAALIATPAGWFAIAAAGLTALALAISNDWGGIRTFLEQNWQALLSPIGLIRLAFEGLSNVIGPALRALMGNEQFEALLSAWRGLQSGFDGILGGIAGLFEAMWNRIRPVVEFIEAAAERVGNAFSRSAPNPNMTPDAREQRRQNAAAGGARRIDDADWNAATEMMARAAGQTGGTAPTTQARPPAPAAPPPQRVDTGGQLNIRVQDDRRPQVTGRPNDPRQSWSVDQGYSMVMP